MKAPEFFTLTPTHELWPSNSVSSHQMESRYLVSYERRISVTMRASAFSTSNWSAPLRL